MYVTGRGTKQRAFFARPAPILGCAARAAGRRALWRRRAPHGLPPRASIDSQAPLSHRFSFRMQNSHYINWPTAGQTLTTLLHMEAQPCWVRLIYFNDQDTPRISSCEFPQAGCRIMQSGASMFRALVRSSLTGSAKHPDSTQSSAVNQLLTRTPTEFYSH
jgi:hypothetical protein